MQIAYRFLNWSENLQRTGRKGMLLHVTPKGGTLYDEVMPVAQRSQAAMILKLSPEVRRTLYFVLKQLRNECGDSDADVT